MLPSATWEKPRWSACARSPPRARARGRIDRALLRPLRRLVPTTPRCRTFFAGKLLKAGAPCYVRETEDAFISSEDLRAMFLAFGAIPTYPVLATQYIRRARYRGAPRPSGSIGLLCNRSDTPPQYARAPGGDCLGRRRRWWPVFNGTEHNTPEARPLLDPYALDPEFEPWFRQSTALMLGHQAAVGRASPGLLEKTVNLPSPARKHGSSISPT